MSMLTVFYYTPLKAGDMTELIQAARTGDLDEAIRLVSKGADVNEIGPQYNLTPLHLACLHGHLEVAQFLLDNGANPDAQDNWQCTPLHNAAGAGHEEIVKELCEVGADLHVRCTNKGKTPVDIARDKGKFNVVPMLQDYISVRSREGKQAQLDRVANAQMVGAGSGSKPVVRWKDKEAVGEPSYSTNGRSTNGNNHFELPGQIYSRSNSREGSAKYSEEKSKLQKEIRRLELQERIHRLEKEKSKTWSDFEQKRGKYDQELENLAKAIQKLKADMDSVADQRENELGKMEIRINELDENAYKMVQEWNSDDEN
ncbi:hypothetical protein TCAL_13102 [Tigriopus californicus]|uniref:Uncharacterized protein n=1 Tax=Tigriopus californicus TaxID=6832 RepID=A0A553NSY5_TIGCA|nr:poly [ADP-ribose] polymerase tankyrase-like [Tigriopus californicus]TRY68529.1 hypothetical protein TCAL_13102 [Tigriopus californicus]|eukprot:TCALIF_13102-PA protein Name:"Similar to Tnni3k Serine/threonine-protein kinase TNNI3K (Rattus norvegicus)" AED:0.07 eAED:0.07 QI:0/-1/0/1/-1/1/1/0/313